MTIFTIGPLPRPLQGFRLFSGKSARRPRLLTSTKIKLFSRLFCAECRVWLITAVTGVLGELETSDKFSNEFAGVEIIFKIFTLACWSMKSAHGSTLSADMSKFNDYHSFPWYATLENKTPAETFPKFPSVLRVIDRSDQNPPITATSMTFTPSLRHAKRAVIGEFRSDLSITCMIDGNFGNVSAGVLFSKVAYQGKRW